MRLINNNQIIIFLNVNLFKQIKISWDNRMKFFFMNKKGYTTESGGRQNGFAIEPEINPLSEGETKKSLYFFIGILLPFLLGGFFYLKTLS